MRTLLIASIASISLLAGCGISDSTELGTLDVEQMTELCEDVPETEFVCGEGDAEFTISFGGDCDTTTVLPETCTATVGEFKDCMDALAAASAEDMCALEFPSECDAAFESSCAE